MTQNSSSFFQNSSCSYFPCHKLEGDFNCLFCYCPLYSLPVCPGNPTYITKEDGTLIKRCTDCTFPHKAENYERVISVLKRIKKDDFSSEYHHGGEGDSSQISLDFSVNINPLGMSQKVREAIFSSLDDLQKYPDQNSSALRQKLSQVTKIPQSKLFFGNGASEIISLLVNAIRPKKALLVSPCFSGYERALKAYGCNIRYHALKREGDFALTREILPAIDGNDIIFLASPNNPTGKCIDKELLKEIIGECNKKGVFLILDECFLDFVWEDKAEKARESAWNLSQDRSKLIVLNAFTKIYALPGLRLGWCATENQGLLNRLQVLRPEWNISTIAQKAGLACLDEEDYLLKTRKFLANERELVSNKLKALGFTVYKSQTNFLLLAESVKNNNNMSTKLDDFLLKNGILIRNCTDFKGLTQTDYRLAIKSHQENARLLELVEMYRGMIQSS